MAVLFPPTPFDNPKGLPNAESPKKLPPCHAKAWAAKAAHNSRLRKVCCKTYKLCLKQSNILTATF